MSSWDFRIEKDAVVIASAPLLNFTSEILEYFLKGCYMTVSCILFSDLSSEIACFSNGRKPNMRLERSKRELNAILLTEEGSQWTGVK